MVNKSKTNNKSVKKSYRMGMGVRYQQFRQDHPKSNIGLIIFLILLIIIGSLVGSYFLSTDVKNFFNKNILIPLKIVKEDDDKSPV